MFTITIIYGKLNTNRCKLQNPLKREMIRQKMLMFNTRVTRKQATKQTYKTTFEPKTPCRL